MSGRNVSGLMLSVMLLLLIGGSGPLRGAGAVRGTQSTEPVGEVGTGASPAAKAPWFTMEIDTPGDTGEHVSVAIDPHPYYGGIYVSYYDATYGDLRMAHFLGSGGNCGPDDSWYCQTIDSEGDVGQYSSIAVMVGGVNIAYHDATDGDLKWAASTDYPYHRNWSIRTVDRGIHPAKTGLYASLSLPQYGSPRIAYHYHHPDEDDALKLAVYVGGGGDCGYGAHAEQWRCDTIQTGDGVGQHASFVIDDDWHRHIAYYHAADSQLWYATNMEGSNCGPGGNTWTCIPVSGADADEGKYASLYVDSGKHFHIAYYHATEEALYYAVDVGGGGNCGVLNSARCEWIDDMQDDYHPLGISIAQDAAGYPVIAYQNYDGSLAVARPLAALGLPPGGNCGPTVDLFQTWSCEEVDPHGDWVFYQNGDHAAIAVNPSGLATIAYQGFIKDSVGNLMVARQRAQSFLPLVLKVE